MTITLRTNTGFARKVSNTFKRWMNRLNSSNQVVPRGNTVCLPLGVNRTVYLGKVHQYPQPVLPAAALKREEIDPYYHKRINPEFEQVPAYNTARLRKAN